VARAHGIASAADARVVVVAAYEPDVGPDVHDEEGGRRLLVGEAAARDAMRKSVAVLTSDRIRDVEQVIVAGKPAEALLRVAGDNPATLIVVGNRGLGAAEGEVLGSVPREIVRNAVSDVTVIQTPAEPGGSSPVLLGAEAGQ
jgi:maltose/moltooligosaccharide transporter